MCVNCVQVRSLTQEMGALEDENARLAEVISAEQPHNEELLLHVKELQHVSTMHCAHIDCVADAV